MAATRAALLLACISTTSALLIPAARLAPASRPRAPAPRAEEDERNIVTMASNACDQIMQMLGDGVDPPKEIPALKALVRDGGDPKALSTGIYRLVVEQHLDYEVEDGKLVPTTVDYANNPDDEKAREKLSYAYRYGITMFTQGMLDAEPLKEVVLEKIAGRVGMTGEELDKWLAIPKV